MPYDHANIIKTEEYKGYTIQIVVDDDPLNPRTENDNVGTMLCLHDRYKLGDDHQHDCKTPEDVHTKITDKPSIYLPLYLYDHSGLTISTTPFSCPWDSGQIGYIYVTEEKARTEYGIKNNPLTDEDRTTIHNRLVDEVKEYDYYLRGECYGYRIMKKCSECGNLHEIKENGSCYGFLGDSDYVLTEARGEVDCLVS